MDLLTIRVASKHKNSVGGYYAIQTILCIFLYAFVFSFALFHSLTKVAPHGKRVVVAILSYFVIKNC